jgi:hypothetical protein
VVQGQLPAFVAYTLPSSVEASALVIESTFAPACSGIQLGLWRSSPFLANNSLPDVQVRSVRCVCAVARVRVRCVSTSI